MKNTAGTLLMVNKKTSTNDIALRVATAMQQMGIDGLPRNYELVYEAYAGSNPDLVRDFIGLGKFKTQAALDELGRKYLPHHHETGVLQRSAGAVRNEMSNFMLLLKQEKSSLSDYGRIIGEAERAFHDGEEWNSATLGSSIEALRRATEQQVSRNAAMAESVTEQTNVVSGLEQELAAFEATKFADPLTGLGNRRAFNKALAKVYSNPEMPLLCGVIVADVDAGRRFSPQQIAVLSDHIARYTGEALRPAFPASDLAVRFDGLRFGFLFYTSEETEILRMMSLISGAMRMATLRHPQTGRALGSLTLSAGLCMSNLAGNSFDLVSAAEKALAIARDEGGDRVVVYKDSDEGQSGKEWMIYRAS
ncbi:diguanylate cyclase [Sinorhizobium sp. BG8]|uniref:diguanylate cyclase domain-containing protein n=1 Tax=Sinorhizobium sp. BG8 TaxID=2613773 RepID=UPI00193D39C5|nr:diguanylate cyclase [Sinorhizobium sp. BG8]QRM54532.1 diguanylate cyclase [Sinorhizobium sp. BG8]